MVRERGAGGPGSSEGLEGRLDRASRRLAGSLGPVARRLHALGDRAREGMLDAFGSAGGGDRARNGQRRLLETWRQLDLVGGDARAERAEAERGEGGRRG